MIRTSVIIATYNRAPYLVRTLESLARQTLDPALFEVVVVNNNSTDDTLSVCGAFAAAHPELQVVTVTETRQGLSHARNCGIAAARGTYLVFVDDDEEADPDFVKTHDGFLEAHPDAAACGGVMKPVYEYPTPRWLSPYMEKLLASALDLGPGVRLFTGRRYPIGGNMSFRRTMVEKYGLFNPDLGRTGTSPLGGEEKDVFDRLRRGGERIYYLPGAVIYHLIPESRLTREYFDKLTRMIGVSERIRTRRRPTAYAARLFSEGVKWCGAAVLALGYALRFQPAKGGYLLRMRWNITRGLLCGKTEK